MNWGEIRVKRGEKCMKIETYIVQNNSLNPLDTNEPQLTYNVQHNHIYVWL